MKIKKGWQLLGAVEPINMMTIFEGRCVKSLFTYKNSEWLEYKFNYDSSLYDDNITDRGIKKGDGFWINGLSDDNCSVNLYEGIEPILVGRTGNLGSFSYSGKNIISSKESFYSMFNELNTSSNSVLKGSLDEANIIKWASILAKTDIDFEKNNIFLNVFHKFSICEYQIAVNFENNVYSINTNNIYTHYVYTPDSSYKSFYCNDTIVDYLMVFRVSKQIKSFEVKSFKDEVVSIENK